MTDRPVIHGWRETLLIVTDIDDWVRTYAEVGGWELLYAGDVAPEVVEYLRAPAATRAREAVIGKPGATFGFVRLVAFDDGERRPVIRSYGRPWEIGGWFDINVRVDDMDARFAQLQDLGWGGVSDPIGWNFGPLKVREWLAYGPDGIVWALIQRIDPPLPPAEQPGRMSAHFNSTQIVADFAAARHFYIDLLGFEILVEIDDKPMTNEPRQNVLGLPEETSVSQHWNVSMLKAPGAPGGSIELLSLPGISGRDFAPLAQPPNRGIISHRFPVDDLDALHSHLRDADIPIVCPPQILPMPPGAPIRIMTARGPCGALLDFFASE